MLGVGEGEGGYGISMGLKYFQKFLDKPMQQGEGFWKALIFFGKFYISLEVVPIKTWVLQVISKWRVD